MSRCVLILLAVFAFAAVVISPTRADDTFKEYAAGAMTVYSKFAEPSKEESERFLAFIKTRWESNRCVNHCAIEGKNAGEQYVAQMQVPVDDDA